MGVTAVGNGIVAVALPRPPPARRARAAHMNPGRNAAQLRSQVATPGRAQSRNCCRCAIDAMSQPSLQRWSRPGSRHIGAMLYALQLALQSATVYDPPVVPVVVPPEYV